MSILSIILLMLTIPNPFLIFLLITFVLLSIRIISLLYLFITLNKYIHNIRLTTQTPPAISSHTDSDILLHHLTLDLDLVIVILTNEYYAQYN